MRDPIPLFLYPALPVQASVAVWQLRHGIVVSIGLSRVLCLSSALRSHYYPKSTIDIRIANQAYLR